MVELYRADHSAGNKKLFCAYWHKYCIDFGIAVSIVKPVTSQKAYTNHYIYKLLYLIVEGPMGI